jgi:hypothetical protein
MKKSYVKALTYQYGLHVDDFVDQRGTGIECNSHQGGVAAGGFQIT